MAELRAESPYILEIDRESVSRYTDSVGVGRINDESVPEPFIGNPELATVVLLNLNPGDSDKDSETHKDVAFRSAMEHNLRHEPQEYPFYPLNPQFGWTECACWWRRHLRGLLEAGLDSMTVAEKLLVIEWFPYHSKKSALPCGSRESALKWASCQIKFAVGIYVFPPTAGNTASWLQSPPPGLAVRNS